MNAAIARLRALMDPDILAATASELTMTWDDTRFCGSGEGRVIVANGPARLQDAPETHSEGYRHHAHIGRMPSPQDSPPGSVSENIARTRHGTGVCRICQGDFTKLTRTHRTCGNPACKVETGTRNHREYVKRAAVAGKCKFCGDAFVKTGNFQVICVKDGCAVKLKATHRAAYMTKKQPGDRATCVHRMTKNGISLNCKQLWRCGKCGHRTSAAPNA